MRARIEGELAPHSVDEHRIGGSEDGRVIFINVLERIHSRGG